MNVLQARALPGAIEAVAGFARREAIPILLRTLEDDVARLAAKDALQKLRWLAIANLIEGPLASDGWRQLRFLLYQYDPALATLARQIALRIGHESDQARASLVALDGLGSTDWTVVAEAEQALIQHLRMARAAIEKEILN